MAGGRVKNSSLDLHLNRLDLISRTSSGVVILVRLLVLYMYNVLKDGEILQQGWQFLVLHCLNKRRPFPALELWCVLMSACLICSHIFENWSKLLGH